MLAEIQPRLQRLANTSKRRASGFPKDKSVELWTAEARVVSELREAQANPIDRQKKVDEALALLDEAQRQLGDRVELRLQRARLLVTKMGPQVVPALLELAQNIKAFSKDDRRKLLYGLAELVRQKNSKEAHRLWSQLAEDDPDDIRLPAFWWTWPFNSATRTRLRRTSSKSSESMATRGYRAVIGRPAI